MILKATAKTKLENATQYTQDFFDGRRYHLCTLQTVLRVKIKYQLLQNNKTENHTE